MTEENKKPNEIVKASDLELAGSDINCSDRAAAKGSRAFFYTVLIIGLAIITGIVYGRFSTDISKKQANTLDTERSGIFNTLKAPKAPRPTPPPVVVEQIEVPEPVRETYLPPPVPEPTPKVIIDAPIPTVDNVAMRRLQSPLNANGSNAVNEQQNTSKNQQIADSGPLSDKLRPLELTPSVAGQLGDRNFLITQGTMIDCTLQTKLVSTQPGMLTCLATHDVMSANGKVKLIDAGTKFTGYQSGGIEQGQARAFITWNRLETPTGVILNIGSPGTDALGAAGVDGYVDNHFWDRFGNAILLSLVGDFGNWAANRGNQSSNNISFDNTRQGSQDAVSKILEKSLDIPPTLYKNQGERVGIMVARDLDFKGVYELDTTY